MILRRPVEKKQPIIQVNCGYLTVQLFKLLFSSVEGSVNKRCSCVRHIKKWICVVFFPFAFDHEERHVRGEQWSLIPDLGALCTQCLCSESHCLMSCLRKTGSILIYEIMLMDISAYNQKVRFSAVGGDIAVFWWLVSADLGLEVNDLHNSFLEQHVQYYKVQYYWADTLM